MLISVDYRTITFTLHTSKTDTTLSMNLTFTEPSQLLVFQVRVKPSTTDVWDTISVPEHGLCIPHVAELVRGGMPHGLR